MSRLSVEKLRVTLKRINQSHLQLIVVTVRPITLSSIKQIALDLNLRYYNRESSFYIPSISHRFNCISMHSFNMPLYYDETRGAPTALSASEFYEVGFLLLSSIFVWIYELKHKAAFFDVLIERKKQQCQPD